MAQGTSVLGRYLLGRELGAGGMATVRVGRQRGIAGFGKTVAVKMLHAHLAQDAQFVAMLLDEARLASRIQHANVVQVLDVVVDNDRLALVFDYIHGESLARLLRTASRPVPPAIAVRVAIDTLHGLHAAHEALDESGAPLEIVHRDVSPQNVLVGVDGVARVLDFGIAKAARRLQETASGDVKGKIAYMAPEQIRGEAVDRRSDVFAAAIVLWEMLAGRRLFGGDDVVHAVANHVILPLPEGTPHELDSIVRRALARTRDERFASASEMASALMACAPATNEDVARWISPFFTTLEASKQSIAELESAPLAGSEEDALHPPVHEAAAATVTDLPAQRSSTPRRPRRAALALAAILMTAVVTAGAVTFGRIGRGGAEPHLVVSSASEPVAVAVAVFPASVVASAVSAPVPVPVSAPVATSAVVGRGVADARAKADKSRCQPPYKLGEDGSKIYKRECLQR